MTSRPTVRPRRTFRPADKAAYTVEIRGFVSREAARSVARQISRLVGPHPFEVFVAPGNAVMSDRIIERVSSHVGPIGTHDGP